MHYSKPNAVVTALNTVINEAYPVLEFVQKERGCDGSAELEERMAREREEARRQLDKIKEESEKMAREMRRMANEVDGKIVAMKRDILAQKEAFQAMVSVGHCHRQCHHDTEPHDSCGSALNSARLGSTCLARFARRHALVLLIHKSDVSPTSVCPSAPPCFVLRPCSSFPPFRCSIFFPINYCPIHRAIFRAAWIPGAVRDGDGRAGPGSSMGREWGRGVPPNRQPHAHDQWLGQCRREDARAGRAA